MQRQHCRQTDAQVVEPGADSTLLVVTLLIMIVTRLFVIVSGEGGKQEYRQVSREYRQREESRWMNPSGWRIHHVVSR